MREERKGMLIVVSGPSGTGKGTLCERLLAEDPSLTFSVSATTRAPRSTEIEGVHYFFISDEKYDELSEDLHRMGYLDQLIFLNRELFRMIEDTVSIDLLSRLLSSQLVTKSEKHLLDHDRTYYKLLRSIISAGQECGELREDVSVNDIVKAYAMYERAIMYDWCLCGGDYSLCSYSSRMLPLLLRAYTTEAKDEEQRRSERASRVQ